MGIRGLEPIIRTAINNNPIPVNNLVCGIQRLRLSELVARHSYSSNSVHSTPVVCFDTSEFVHRSTNKNPDAHVSGIFNLIVKVIQHVRPIFVFDGKPPKEKMRTLDERRRAKAKAHEKLKTLTDMMAQASELKETVESIKQSLIILDDDASTKNQDLVFNMTATRQDDESEDTKFNVWARESPSHGSSVDDIMSSESSLSSMQVIFNEEVLAGGGQLSISSDELLNKIQEHIDRLKVASEKTKKKTHRLTDKQIQEIKTLLECFGIPYIHVDAEADAICTMLVKIGIADYGASNDMDLLAFGCPAIIRNINFLDDYVDVYEIDKINQVLEISHEQFIDLCIILGCDYADRLIGLKNSMALPLIKQYGSIENIIANLDIINQTKFIDQDQDTDESTGINNYRLKISDDFEYKDARSVFNIQLDTEYILSLVPENAFDNVIDICNKIILNPVRYREITEFCNTYCVGLNSHLINHKLALILNAEWIRTDRDDNYIMVSKDRHHITSSEISSTPRSKYWPHIKKHGDAATLHRSVTSYIPVVSSRTIGNKWIHKFASQKPSFSRVEFSSSPSSRSLSC